MPLLVEPTNGLVVTADANDGSAANLMLHSLVWNGDEMAAAELRTEAPGNTEDGCILDTETGGDAEEPARSRSASKGA
jgi:hypothetical protein